MKTPFGLSCAGLTELAEVVKGTTLASEQEAYMSIIPAFDQSGQLPKSKNLFGDIVDKVH